MSMENGKTDDSAVGGTTNHAPTLPPMTGASGVTSASGDVRNVRAFPWSFRLARVVLAQLYPEVPTRARPRIYNYVEVYDKLTAAMWTEEEIVSRRVGWLLTIQGVIAAGLGTVLMGGASQSPYLSHIIYVLYLAGSISALLGGVGVLASKMGADFYRSQVWVIAEQARDVVQRAIGSGAPDVTDDFKAASDLLRFPAVIRLLSPSHRGRHSVTFGRTVDCGLPWLVWSGWLELARYFLNPSFSSPEIVVLGRYHDGYIFSNQVQMVAGAAFLLYYLMVWIRARRLDTWWRYSWTYDKADPVGLLGGDRESEPHK